MKIKFSWLIAGFLGFGLANSEASSVDGYEVITDYPLYYSLGGVNATHAPASNAASLETLRTKSSLRSTVCGSFSPSIDIQDMLTNQLNDTLASLTAIPQTITGALPGYVLCRAKPGMCQLLQHYVVRAEKKWDISVKSCEENMEHLESGNDPFQDMIKISRAQKWQEQANAGTSATAAKRIADNSDGCINWVAGRKSGCKGSEPIWLLQDTSRAGWCMLHKQKPDCKSTPGTTNSDSHLQKLWDTPDSASEWITDVLGDYRIQAGESSSTISGAGLLPKVDEEMDQVKRQLTQVVYANLTLTDSDLEPVKSSKINLSPELIAALRDLPDRDFLISRLSSEIALARIVDKAFLARRLLLSGLMEPNIQNSGTATETIHKKLEILEKDIDSVTFEMQIRKRLVSDTVLNILGAHQAFTTPGPSVRRTEQPQIR